MVAEPVTTTLAGFLSIVFFYLLKVIAALIILLIGWIVGKAAGKLVSGLLDRMGVDDAVARTFLGDVVARSGMTVKGLFDALVRWFIYIIFIMAAVNVLDIPVFTALLQQFVLYLPDLIAGILILIVGLILVNAIMNWIGRELEASGVAFADAITMLLRALFSLIVVILALDQARIDTRIIYTFLTPLAWGLAVGIAIAIGIGIGWGSKDTIAQYLKENRPAMEREVARRASGHMPPKEEP